jgi:hypothetical protein
MRHHTGVKRRIVMSWTRLVQIAFIAAVIWAVWLAVGLFREFWPEIAREWRYWKEDWDEQDAED